MTISCPAGSSRRPLSMETSRMRSAARSKRPRWPGRRRLGRGQLGVGVVDVVPGAVGEHRVHQVGLDLGRDGALGEEFSPGRRCRGTRRRSPSRPWAAAPGAPRPPSRALQVRVDQDRRGGDGVRASARPCSTMPYSVSIPQIRWMATSVKPTDGRSDPGARRRAGRRSEVHLAVATRSMARPPSGSVSGFFTRVRT